MGLTHPCVQKAGKVFKRVKFEKMFLIEGSETQVSFMKTTGGKLSGFLKQIEMQNL